MNTISRTCVALSLPLALLWACGDNGDSGNGGTAANGTGANGSGGDLVMGGENSGPGTGGVNNTGGTTSTGGATNTGGLTSLCDGDCICSNGLDDDDDGLIDGFDPECTGPYDNDESTFATGIPGDNRDPKWQDCFFDGNSGAGDDDCRYHTDCLTGGLPPDDANCTLTEACLEFCAPLTPNGCDCFGCCTVDLPDGSTLDIVTGNSCSLDQVEDEDACPRCVKSEVCGNTCGTCELCPGKTIEDLPAECTPGAGGAPGVGGAPGDPVYTCDDGEQVCGPDLPGCPIGRYCSLGCCLQTPPK
ncbi:MAG TPA: hypothetical protein VJN18_02370 [Polyangiaceae bacterium]|nr:hypothetical protein [Polyangiaceae bacterium]